MLFPISLHEISHETAHAAIYCPVKIFCRETSQNSVNKQIRDSCKTQSIVTVLCDEHITIFGDKDVNTFYDLSIFGLGINLTDLLI